ncbi:MAG: hypothetical protein QNM02_10375 [Acidimicrobiia bacterium]|nr:hypothetical protein [Acidimicrobiia bacterium]
MTLPSLALGVVAAGDPDADRIVYGAVIALVVIGLVLIGVGTWLFRQTRVDPELLAPLERMNDRTWSRRDPATQRRMLDEVRPDDAVPLHREPMEPTPDEEFEQTDRPVESFDDLKDPVPAADSDDSTMSEGAESGDDSVADEPDDLDLGVDSVADETDDADLGDDSVVDEPDDEVGGADRAVAESGDRDASPGDGAAEAGDGAPAADATDDE